MLRSENITYGLSNYTFEKKKINTKKITPYLENDKNAFIPREVRKNALMLSKSTPSLIKIPCESG